MYVLDATGKIIGRSSTPIPGLICVAETPELDAAYAAYVAAGPPPPAPDPIAVRAAALLAEDGSNLREDVARFLGQVQALAADGVTLPDPMTFRELMTAVEARWPDDKATAAAAGLKLRVAWDDVVYHCGTLKDADEVFPYLMQLVMEQ